MIRQFHPDPVFLETTYAEIPLENFLFPEEMTEKVPSDTASVNSITKALSEDVLDKFIDDLLDSPDLEITPPDLLMSTTYQWSGSDLEQVRDMAKGLPASVVRAKGFLEEKKKILIQLCHG
ncbi:MAG: hypothetical protein ISS61_09215 [Desulfobacteraceae bacterium]|nr:hypothetical protein [Desulfobacteraceae bacterium]